MSNRKGGFDPSRLPRTRGERPVIPEMLSDENEGRAHGFTEIRVIGVGGAGSNTVDRMIEADVRGIEFVAVNSDVQALTRSLARHKVVIGRRLTRGLGTGGDPRLGRRAVEADGELIAEMVQGADMVFVTAGMGGGTGTGAAPWIAQTARSAGALTVGVITRPFRFEGKRRQDVADMGIGELRAQVDALIVIANDRLLDIAPPHVSFTEAFHLADDVLHQGISGITDLVILPGLINLDFADVTNIMYRGGSAHMAIGRGVGATKAEDAVRTAVSSPLLEGSVKGARGILLNIAGGPDLSLHDVTTVAESITSAAARDANIIVGAIVHPRLEGELRLTVIATGMA